MPLRWTAIEVLTSSQGSRKFNSSTDVWSFAVLLHEIFGDGALPYRGMSNAVVVAKVRDGFRLPRLPNCPPVLYQLMRDCWNEEAARRPNFTKLAGVIRRLLRFSLEGKGSLGVQDHSSSADGAHSASLSGGGAEGLPRQTAWSFESRHSRESEDGHTYEYDTTPVDGAASDVESWLWSTPVPLHDAPSSLREGKDTSTGSASQAGPPTTPRLSGPDLRLDCAASEAQEEVQHTRYCLNVPGQAVGPNNTSAAPQPPPVPEKEEEKSALERHYDDLEEVFC